MIGCSKFSTNQSAQDQRSVKLHLRMRPRLSNSTKVLFSKQQIFVSQKCCEFVQQRRPIQPFQFGLGLFFDLLDLLLFFGAVSVDPDPDWMNDVQEDDARRQDVVSQANNFVRYFSAKQNIGTKT